jgi:hypothetical protein
VLPSVDQEDVSAEPPPDGAKPDEVPPHQPDEDPVDAAQRCISEAVDKSAEMLDFIVTAPVKACHCECSFGPEGARCVTQFTDAEVDEVK